MQTSGTKLDTIHSLDCDDPPSLVPLGTLLRCDPRNGGLVCTDSDPYLYGLRSGSARICAPTADGHRQIVDFLLPATCSASARTERRMYRSRRSSRTPR